MSDFQLDNLHCPHIFLNVKERTETSVDVEMRAFSNDFCARGHALFDLAEITNFFKNLRIFPLDNATSTTLAGGYFEDGLKILLSENFHISVQQINSSGLLAMVVKLFSPDPENWRNGFGAGGKCSYYLNYLALGEFINGFEKLILGDCSDFKFSQLRTYP